MFGLLLACTGAAPPKPATLPGLDTAAAACQTWAYVEPTEWTIEGGTWVPAVNEAADCELGIPSVHLDDLTGDGLPELVMTDACDDESLGRDTWRVWPGVDGGFGDPVDWALPAGFGVGAFADPPRSAADCTGVEDLPAWFTATLDGDALPDLVMTESCVDTTPSTGVWTVWPNTGAGFGAAVAREVDTRWTLGALVHPQVEAQCGSAVNIPAWHLRDIDGDDLVDVVITTSCVDPAVGDTEWEVLHNDGASFTTIAWPVVEALGMTGASRSIDSCLDYFLMDTDGDDRSDVVATDECSGSGYAWSVYANTGLGYSPTGERKVVPWNLISVLDGPERATAQCTIGLPAWTFEDVDQDGAADLTVTTSCTDPSVGDSRWTWWTQGDLGWEVPQSWLLPANYSPGSFSGNQGSTLKCAGAQSTPRWMRRDLDNDGSPELVVTQTCDDPTAARWLVYSPTCVD